MRRLGSDRPSTVVAEVDTSTVDGSGENIHRACSGDVGVGGDKKEKKSMALVSPALFIYSTSSSSSFHTSVPCMLNSSSGSLLPVLYFVITPLSRY